jgi:hypothetical protein
MVFFFSRKEAKAFVLLRRRPVPSNKQNRRIISLALTIFKADLLNMMTSFSRKEAKALVPLRRSFLPKTPRSGLRKVVAAKQSTVSSAWSKASSLPKPDPGGLGPVPLS